MTTDYAKTHTHNRLTALCLGLPGGTVPIPTHTHPGHQTSFINFFHLVQSIASSLFNLPASQSFSTTSVQVLFGLEPSALYSIHSFTHLLSSFRNTCQYHPRLFYRSTKIMSSVPNLCLNSSLGNLSFTLMPHIHLTILIPATNHANIAC